MTDILVLTGVRAEMITLATDIALGMFGPRTDKYASAISYMVRRKHDSPLRVMLIWKIISEATLISLYCLDSRSIILADGMRC